ncbi:glutamate 5-kinase [Virgibacillus ihumii]|uniref:glutamate 5-kinase n=1 Tax=Virgibacillus ihumii TaxID=2686091 RepID=UPI00157D1AAE|nr:glutamate 5-kinase [Virgibacillus ihumii]
MKKQRIVVKIGSSSLTTKKGGLSDAKLREHVTAIARLKQLGHEVILISSGAVAAGFADLGYPSRPKTIASKQAVAAVGQGLLIKGYTEEFKRHGIVAAQLMLTRENFLHKDQYNNANAALSELLKRNVLPIINENDSVAVDELTFGDNDMLSALVSGLVHADFLMILTDINGIYDQNPQTYPDAKRYDFLHDIDDELIRHAAGTGTKVGTGGMKSKLEAAQTSLNVGVKVFIGFPTGEEKFVDVLAGKGDGTYIGDTSIPSMNTSKQWLALHSIPNGKIEVDQGAAAAILEYGKSLLPAGVTNISGTFQADDVVRVVNINGDIIGRGKVNFSSDQLSDIRGLSSTEAMIKINSNQRVVIHRDNWVSKKRKENEV